MFRGVKIAAPRLHLRLDFTPPPPTSARSSPHARQSCDLICRCPPNCSTDDGWGRTNCWCFEIIECHVGRLIRACRCKLSWNAVTSEQLRRGVRAKQVLAMRQDSFSALAAVGSYLMHRLPFCTARVPAFQRSVWGYCTIAYRRAHRSSVDCGQSRECPSHGS